MTHINIKSKKDLMRVYKISYPTLIKWLSKVPGIDPKMKRHFFTPNEMNLIFSHIGEPDI